MQLNFSRHLSRNSRVILASGYFDPLWFHIGHIDYLEQARKLGTKLVVIVNSDEQAFKKKGYVFMPQEDRIRIVKSLRSVSDAFISIDSDKSVNLSIARAFRKYGNIYAFAKGGDRNKENIPEADICHNYKIKIIDGLGEKVRSSSSLVEKIESYFANT